MPYTSDFRQTWLWRHAFVNPLPNITADEQEFFRQRYLVMRERAEILVSQITNSIPGLTVHDITHLDALWETASLVADGAITISPAEAFVFGASVLLHDSGLSLAAYPNGIDDLKTTTEWKDTVAALFGEPPTDSDQLENPPEDILRQAIPHVLRQLHAKQAEVLATSGWKSDNGETFFLLDDSDLRSFYGESIGQIAHSHWWSLAKIEQELSEDLGALPNRTRSLIDRIKIACLLRLADALHLDQRRAPRFLRAITHPSGESALHWTFQERLAAPHIEHESVIFSAGAPFTIDEADAWWLAYDTIFEVDRELRDVDLLMQNRARGQIFRARRAKGAGSPEALARTIRTRGWRPVDTQIRVSDIPKLVETLGGSKLYGDDPIIALRELIQNSADAIQARRRFQRRSADWGAIIVSIEKSNDGYWLAVEDNGIGMSEPVLTGPLIDFGSSFWRSSLATQEFPGLISSGMNAIGRFGIGFFSVFMIGSVVRVYSRRHDKAADTARLLEFRDGTTSRPILSPSENGRTPIDGGTRVEILLKLDPLSKGGILHSGNYNGTSLTLTQLVASIAPSVSVSILVKENEEESSAVNAGDWLTINDSDFMSRLDPLGKMKEVVSKKNKKQTLSIRSIHGPDANPLGRARIRPKHSYLAGGGWVTIGGLRSSRLANIEGIFVGETMTASRNSAIPVITKEQLALWATEQAKLISSSQSEDSMKAKCAEVVLECGGDIGSLPIVCWGSSDWLNSEQLRTRLLDKTEFAVCFDGEFNYDEDYDDVLPRDFKSSFEINRDIAIVTKHDGSILSIGGQPWPRSLTGRSLGWGVSNLSVEVRRVLSEAWGESIEESEDDCEVGTVLGTEITRNIHIFRHL